MTFKQLLSIEDIEKDSKGIYHSISQSVQRIKWT